MTHRLVAYFTFYITSLPFTSVSIQTSPAVRPDLLPAHKYISKVHLQLEGLYRRNISMHEYKSLFTTFLHVSIPRFVNFLALLNHLCKFFLCWSNERALPGSTLQLNLIVAFHYVYYTRNGTGRLHSKPITNIELRSVIQFLHSDSTAVLLVRSASSQTHRVQRFIFLFQWRCELSVA